MKKPNAAILIWMGIGLTLGACARKQGPETKSAAYAEAQNARDEQKARGLDAVVSPDTQKTVREAIANPPQIGGTAKIAILYFLDQPAHRQAVRAWLTKNNATIFFDNPRFGYLDARLDWKSVGELIKTAGNLGLDQTSFMKLELDSLKANPPAPESVDPPNTSFNGPVHSAGFGANVEKFRMQVAADFNKPMDQFEGQGTRVAVFDSNIDLSRTDVYGNRVVDALVGDGRNWYPAEQTLAKFLEIEKETEVPAGLEDIKGEPTLRLMSLNESDLNYDLNGSGSAKDVIAVAVFKKNDEWLARFRPIKGLPFGDSLMDLAAAHLQGKPQLIDLTSGKYYHRAEVHPSSSAVAIKIRVDEENQKVSLAFLGTVNKGDHGIANLHMVGGDFKSGRAGVPYRGVAPQTEFLVTQTWLLDGSEYADRWAPLARNVIQAAEARADVIDLDIATPGTRDSNDLLSRLMCRITERTNSVIVVAAHNYGPLPSTVQSLAQSPCVLGIGASHSVASLREGRYQGSLDPALAHDDDVQTANYSGRGFGLNGQFKPDIISPAYGYTAYGSQFIRFSGTSGATPATAGMIALLKQAARLKHIELSFTQIKFLLQASSRPLSKEQVRDGYGFTDLAAAWELLKKYIDVQSGEFKLGAFQLLGQQNLQFEGRPERNLIPISLSRPPIEGADTSPTPISFKIEYAGASTASTLHWLKFYDPSTGHEVETLNRDAPMAGEVQNLPLSIKISDADWESLPPGDYIAVVKGVRSEFAGGQAVDFLLPVSFNKPLKIDEGAIDIRPLYGDQYQVANIATASGEVLWISAETRCMGQAIGSALRGGPSDSLRLSVENEAFYPEAASVMNNYANLSTSLSPIRIVARRSIVRLSVSRYSQMNCDGAISARVYVRRTGVKLESSRAISRLKDGKTNISISADISLTGELLSPTDLSRAVNWKFELKNTTLVLRKSVNEETTYVLPSGVRSVRILPETPSKFQGILSSQNCDGTIDQQTNTRSDADYGSVAGLGSLSMELQGDFIGLQLTDPKAGNTLRYTPSSTSDGATSRAVIEMTMDLPKDVTASIGTQTAIKSWLPTEIKTLSISAITPLARPEEFKEFPSPDWNYELAIGITLKETMANGNPDASYLPLDIWKGLVRIPLTLQ